MNVYYLVSIGYVYGREVRCEVASNGDLVIMRIICFCKTFSLLR